MSSLLDKFNRTGRSMGPMDGLAFGFIFIGYIALLGIHVSSFLVCNPEVSDETFHLTIGLSAGLMALFIIYAALVFAGKCGGDSAKGKRTSAIIVTAIILALTIADLVFIVMSYDERTKPTTSSNETTYNIIFACITLAIIVGCFFYFGYQVNDLS